MFVKEIMSDKVVWVTPDYPIAKVARRMRDFDLGCLPVRKDADGKLMGMVTDRDIACRCVAEGLDPHETTVGDIMSTGAACCFDDQEITEAARLMGSKKVHRLPVMNHDKEVVGMLSLSDLGANCTGETWSEVAKAVSTYHH